MMKHYGSFIDLAIGRVLSAQVLSGGPQPFLSIKTDMSFLTLLCKIIQKNATKTVLNQEYEYDGYVIQSIVDIFQTEDTYPDHKRIRKFVVFFRFYYIFLKFLFFV